MHYNAGTTTRLDINSQKIKIENPTQTFSISVWVKGKVGISVVGYASDNDVSFSSWYTATSANNSYGDWTLLTFNNKSIVSGSTTSIASIAFNITSIGSEFWLSQPMMVFSNTVGDYVPGQYNNNDRVLKIEESAENFQISIGESVKDAQNSADSANTKVDNISVGTRNYVLNSSGLNGSATVRPTLSGSISGANAMVTYPSDGILMTNGATNTTTEWYYQVANAWAKFSDTPLNPGDQITFSADVMGTVPQAVLRYGFNGGTGGKEGYKNFDINNTSWTRVSITVTSTPTNTGLYFRIQGGKNNQYTNGWSGGETLKFRYVKIEKGNTATDWTPAPEDVESGINSAKTSADSAKTKIDNLSVGGRNLLLNSTFTSGFTSWNNENNSWTIDSGTYD